MIGVLLLLKPSICGRLGEPKFILITGTCTVAIGVPNFRLILFYHLRTIEEKYLLKTEDVPKAHSGFLHFPVSPPTKSPTLTLAHRTIVCPPPRQRNSPYRLSTHKACLTCPHINPMLQLEKPLHPIRIHIV